MHRINPTISVTCYQNFFRRVEWHRACFRSATAIHLNRSRESVVSSARETKQPGSAQRPRSPYKRGRPSGPSPSPTGSAQRPRRPELRGRPSGPVAQTKRGRSPSDPVAQPGSFAQRPRFAYKAPLAQGAPGVKSTGWRRPSLASRLLTPSGGREGASTPLADATCCRSIRPYSKLCIPNRHGPPPSGER